MREIGILGGTFDPIHNGHLIAARAAMEQFGLEKVLLMTGGNPPHKRGHVTPARDRHEMVRLAAKGEAGLVPFDRELNKKTYSYTYETLTELCEQYPGIRWHFIIGGDSLRDLPSWRRPEMIAKKCVLLVYPRSSASETELIAKRAAELDADIREIRSPLFCISSTELRERVCEGRSIRYFVPDSVNDYINEHGLYRQGTAK